jgi:hypothetical protein
MIRNTVIGLSIAGAAMCFLLYQESSVAEKADPDLQKSNVVQKVETARHAQPSKIPAEKTAVINPAELAQPIFIFESPAEAKIRQQLDILTTVEFDDISFAESVRQLGLKSQLKFSINEQTDGSGVDQAQLEMKISLTRTDVPLWQVLEQLVQQVESDFVIQDDRVLIVAAGPEQYVSAIYPCADLARDQNRRNELISLIVNETEGYWEEVDGEGGQIEFILASESLQIRHNAATHKRAAIVLEALRKAKLSQLQLSERLEFYKQPPIDHAGEPAPAENTATTGGGIF